MILGPQILINAQVWVRAHNACVMEPPPRKPPWTAEGGLTAAQAQRRGLQDGPNELTPPQRRTLWHRLAEAARDPMLRLLLAASAIYGWLGELSDALVLLGFVLFSAGITLFQEQRTEKVLNALRELSSPRALVIRDGKRQRVSGTEVVCGDLLVVSEGDRIAADAVLRESSALRVDESVLTGESFPVDKSDEHPWIYGGTLVVRGQAVAQVVATGAHTEVGRIGASLADIARPVSPLVTQTRRLVQLFSVLGGLLSLTVLLLYGWARGNWLEASLAGITLAMSLLPEEFALILAVFMAMGAWRLSRHRVLTRRAHALEALGAITVLCTDKTGTLTHNRMQVVAMARWTGAGFEDWRAQEGDSGPPETLAPLARQAMLASEQAPQDPMEMALVTLALRMGSPQDRLDLQAWRCVHTYGWSAHCMAVTRLWQAHPASPEGALWVAAKGAPEAIGTLCRLNDTDREALRAHTAWLAQEGWRVLAVAQGTLQDRPWPSTPEGLTMSLVGLVALADPLREGVRSSVQECLQARIRVVMLTGDHPLTARAIAKQAGLDVSADVVTGDALAAMDASTWQQTVRSASVYARIMPQQKLRIVQALRAQGEVVAMTGDGVNDAPSLQAAHIGIAMGQRGTDVAREAACLVLLDDDFTAIVEAARLGRQMHDNLRKALAFVLAVHVPIAGLALLPVVLGGPLILLPLHIACLELLIDPVCSMAYEAEPPEADLMQRPPRDPQAPLFPWPMVVWSLAQGGVVWAGVATMAVWALQSGLSAPASRALIFCTLLASNVALIVANRAYSQSLWHSLRQPNPILWRLWALMALGVVSILAWAPLRDVFGFELPAPEYRHAALAWALGCVATVWALLGVMRHWRPGRGTGQK
ncbi:MAG: hypothetical protein RI949_589 [Pseudomonadota bacterium]